MPDITQEAIKLNEEVDKVHGPIWTAQIEFLKTLITLASASLVLTVTFSGSFFSRSKLPEWSCAIFLSWLFFSVTVISALIGVWQTSGLRSLAARINNLKPELKRCLAEEADPTMGIQRFQKIIDPAFSAIRPFESRLLMAQRGAFIAYVSAVLSLAIFGLGQFMSAPQPAATTPSSLVATTPPSSLVPPTTFDGVKVRLFECRGLQDSLARLSCYETLTNSLIPPSAR